MKNLIALVLTLLLLTLGSAFSEDIDLIGYKTDEVGENEETTAPFVPIERGSRGENVTALQKKLSDLGYGVGAADGIADGIFGPKTEQALEALQREMGVVVTGRISSAAELNSVLNYGKPEDNKANDDAVDENMDNKSEEGSTVLVDASSEVNVLEEDMNPAADVAPVMGDGVNLLKEAQYHIEKNSKSDVVESILFDIDADVIDLQSLIGKTVIASIYVNSPGARGSSVEDSTNYMYDRFGAHMALRWSDSSGQLEEKVNFPATELLSQTVDNARISAVVTIAPPEGYDQLLSASMAVQSGARPAEGNDAIWVLEDPRIELVKE